MRIVQLKINDQFSSGNHSIRQRSIRANSPVERVWVGGGVRDYLTGEWGTYV